MKLRILLVEDNAVNSELARDLLEASGHTVDVAPDGASFRSLLRSGVVPNIVLMDMLLPDTDGLALLGEMRSSDPLLRVPVVAVTAQALVGDAERLVAAGFDAVITKPIDTRRFVEQIEHHANADHTAE